nr:hypothetical protein [Tanacetum cinerariifolium]
MDDEHLILTTIHNTQKTEVPLPSSFVLADFANQFLNLDNVPPTDTEVISMMNVKVCHEEPNTQTPPLLNIHVTAKDERKRYIDLVEKSVKDIIKDEVKSQLPHILPKEVSDYATPAAASLTVFELKKILLDKIQKNKDKDEDPPAGSDQGLKKRKMSKDAKPLRGSKSKESKSRSSKGSKSQPKSSGKSAQVEEPVFEAADIEMPLNQ